MRSCQAYGAYQKLDSRRNSRQGHHRLDHNKYGRGGDRRWRTVASLQLKPNDFPVPWRAAIKHQSRVICAVRSPAPNVVCGSLMPARMGSPSTFVTRVKKIRFTSSAPTRCWSIDANRSTSKTSCSFARYASHEHARVSHHSVRPRAQGFAIVTPQRAACPCGDTESHESRVPREGHASALRYVESLQ